MTTIAKGVALEHSSAVYVLFDCGAEQGSDDVEVWRGTLDDFLETNVHCFDAAEAARVRGLQVGEHFLSGGGAAPVYRLERVS